MRNFCDLLISISLRRGRGKNRSSPSLLIYVNSKSQRFNHNSKRLNTYVGGAPPWSRPSVSLRSAIGAEAIEAEAGP